MPEKTPHSGGNIKSTGFCLSDVKKSAKTPEKQAAEMRIFVVISCVFWYNNYT